MHRWRTQAGGEPIAPFRSLDEGIASWPEYATCVGLTLTEAHLLEIHAPYGLDDLFNLRLRHNPKQAARSEFLARCLSKNWLEQWPQLVVVSETDAL